MILSNIVIDLRRPSKKLCSVTKQVSVIIQIVDIELKPAPSDFVNVLLRNFVAHLWNYLKGRLDAVGVIEIHQLRREPPALCSFDVVRHNKTATHASRPEPNKG